MKKQRDTAYRPRTRHIHPDGAPKYTNRLFLESSPYLLQHAHNPVNWYPWGDEAFETAKKQNRPVLLSVGYSTCHWCHVMEEESFEDEEIARYMNTHYIAVKVDREERPDIDSIYMNAVQAITGRGGWPMTVWLTPDRKPFYGGTYFPARDGDRGTTMGFLTLLTKINEMYHAQPDRVEQAGRQLTDIIREKHHPKAGDGLPTASLLHQAVDYYKKAFDPDNGGIAGSPKFPSTMPVRVLFRYYRRTGDEDALRMARATLDSMAAGGMYDHVGGGFHRYSTDEKWLVPHFEKMLYDNALLAMDYLEAWQVTGDAAFKRITRDILRYVKRDMTSPEGAFFSATDADSLTPAGHSEEGYFFTWTPEEMEMVLGAERAKIVKTVYAVGETPNFEGRHILHTPKAVENVAESLGMTPESLLSVVEESKELLYKERSRRPPPLRDEKILTAWNGLMISAHARAGLILGEPQYTDRAVRAARFVLEHLYLRNRLYRSYKDGRANHKAFLEDYAFFTAALLDLFEASHDIAWLEKAIVLDSELITRFEDQKNGGFFMAGDDHENLIAREKPGYDGAEPSGNSVAALNLLRLAEYTADTRYLKRAEKVFTTFFGRSESSPIALSHMLLALDFYLDSPKSIAIVTPTGKKDDAEKFLQAFREQFIPNRILAVTTEGEELNAHSKRIPYVREKLAINGTATAFVCIRGNCELPASDPARFARQISEVEKLPDVEHG